jgi:nucleoside-diphosphate-sugar epimerase
MESRKISLVVGGSGFVGVELVRHLVKAGRIVRVFDKNPIGDSEIERNIQFVKGDVRNLDAVRDVVKGTSKVYHLAAMVPLTRAGEIFNQVNAGGTKNVIIASVEAKIQHLVHLSSSAVYGIPSEIPITERSSVDPLGAYGRSKLEGEIIVRRYIEKGLSAAIVRPRTIIGLGRLGIFQILFDMIANERPITILGSGEHDFQLVSNRDLSRALICVSDQKANGIFNVGTGSFTTLKNDLNELAKTVNSASRVKGVPAWFARPMLKFLDAARLSPFVDWHYDTIDKPYWFDCSKIEKELGWIAADSNVDMLVNSYKWYLKNGVSEKNELSTHRSGVSQGLIRIFTGPSASGRKPNS